MKTLKFISCLILFTRVFSFAQKPANNDLHELGITGKVKSLHESIFKAENKSGKITTGKRISNAYDYESKIIFNEKGYKLEETRYSIDGKPTMSFKYTYDDKQNLIEEDRYNADGSLAHKGIFTYKYDELGKIIEKDWMNENNVTEKIIYKRDARGNIVEKNWIKADGTLTLKMTFAYDNNDNLIEDNEWNSKGIVVWRTTYKVNDKGKVIEETVFKNGKKFLIKYTTEYDKAGNETKTNWCRENGKVYATWTYQYEFDQNNNWIKKIELNPDKIGALTPRDQDVVERQIEYFL